MTNIEQHNDGDDHRLPWTSHDSALPTMTTTDNTIEFNDDCADETPTISPVRSRSTDHRHEKHRIDSTLPSLTSTATSIDRFKYGVRYITDGFIRHHTKQNTMSRINTLDLSRLRDKKVRYIENLQGLINLEVLNLSNNVIERIDGLKTLKKLKSLSLANNVLHTINNLEELSQLEILDLHRNQLTDIPIWIGKRLPNLHELNLSHNQIASFDQITRLRSLYQLRRIDLQGNPIEQHEHYRLLVISYITNLERLDGIDITDDERKQAKQQ
jgi:Leucine-rich repeat (LRR) protein